MVVHCNVGDEVRNVGGGVQRQQSGLHSDSCVTPGPCFYPSRLVRGDDDDDGGDGDFCARGVIVEGYCGEVADARNVSAADFARGCDLLEGVHFVAWGVRVEIKSQS